MKKLMAFVLIVAITFITIGVTTPWLVKQVKLGLDLKGGFEILYEASPLNGEGEVTRDALVQTAKSLQARIDATGVTEPEITPEGRDRIRVRIAGVVDEQQIRTRLMEPAVMTFRSNDGCAADKPFCKIELQGTDFKTNGAKATQDQLGRWQVDIALKDANKFAEITGRLTGQPLAIYMDEEQISAPMVNGQIPGGTAQITGDYTHEEARDLADKINLGALPLKLTEKYTQSVGATLGQKSLEQTLYASIVATIAILLFMLLFYRLPGVIAIISIGAFVWLTLLSFWVMGVTLTLPGIAAFVLGIGIAVDSNIITYERLKEELRSGKSLMSAHKAGFKNSFRTIIDAHLTTIIAGLVLFFIGTGSVRGFAVILIDTIIINIITNVGYSRILMHLLVRSDKFKKKSLYGVKESEISAL